MNEYFQAIRSGDVPALVRAFMKSSIDVNHADAEGHTLLHIACQKRNFTLVKYLLRIRHADPTLKDKSGLTALELTPESAKCEMDALFNEISDWRERRKGPRRQIKGEEENKEMLEELETEETNQMSISSMRKLLICALLPFLFLIVYNGLLFAVKFITIAMAFYFISLSYFISEVAIRPPWYHHVANAKTLSMRGCPDYWQGWINNPKIDFNIDYEDVIFESSDNYTLSGWHVPPPEGSSRYTGLVLVHGGGRDRRTWARHVPYLHKAGYGCLLFDFREHGQSSGAMKGFTFGIKERFDVIAATRVMRERFNYVKIGAMGTSVGGSSVIMAAAIDPSIDLVVAENAITTCATLLDQQIVAVMGNYFSHRFLSKICFRVLRRLSCFWLNARVGNVPSKHCQALHCIGKIAPRPVLLMHGTNDVIVPFKHSQILYDAAGDPRELYLCEKAFHCGLYNTCPEDFEKVTLAFLKKYGGTPNAKASASMKID